MRWFFVYVWASFLIFCTSIPSPPKVSLIPHLDKLFHFFGYLILALLVCMAKREANKKAFFYCTLFAVATEMHQVFIPTRCVSAVDFLFNVLGLLLGFFLWKESIFLFQKN